MNVQREIRHFALYGDGNRSIGPEFVHIERISTRSRLHNWRIAPHIHPGIFQLLFMDCGEGVVAMGDAELPLDPPVLVLVPCGCVHAFQFQPPTEGWVLSIADSLVEDRRLAVLEVGSIIQGAQVLRLPLDESTSRRSLLAALLADLARRHSESPGQLNTCVMAVIGSILSLAEELATVRAPQGASGHNNQIALIRRFNRLVEQHLREQWKMARFARALGTSAPTLTRACREVTGKPPGQLVLERRLREAMRALSLTDASISEISNDLGFSDPAYFARIFRRHTGLTASEYRRERLWLT